MNRTTQLILLVLSTGFLACKDQNKSNLETQKVDSKTSQIATMMNSYISIFEIPANDIERAINFYQLILGIKIEKMDMPEMQMGVFPYEEQTVTGVIIKGEGYKPSADGISIYLNGGDNLQIILDKVESSGGKIIVPKSLHADESGYFALFLDSEGNRIGLHSLN